MQSIAVRVFRGTRAIVKYKTERDLLLNNIRRYIGILQEGPEGNYLIEVALNIQSLKVQADKMKWASQALVTDAAAMNFVTSRDARFYLFIVPRACDEVGHCTRHLSELLLDHIHRPVANCERDIAIELGYALADLEAHLE
ncbi:hypothetical protein N7517_006150 [Penicillium concentricum]|uniref:Uncharacterized protein n=1 Tax=Penicillium concentricum TaxID=293559 RepID=A0A9W9SAV1_9EURO|nr:uncharacterized protein N7517_006150 [Penicillium concentricum]KAJ5374144.1 hypothetical protein N7517_006150 [Penicillium concentricum]